MWARTDQNFEEFVVARSQDLHHDAYLLTADQDCAEQLVAHVLAALARDHVDLTRATTTARVRMAQAAAHTHLPQTGNLADLPARFRQLAALTVRQRAILTLEALDGHDLHSAARVLRLSHRDIEQAYAAIPPELTDSGPADLRSLLQDFGDLAENPDPATTLAQTRAVPPPPRRPWWSYVATLLVVAFTVSCLVVTSHWHDDWLHTAAGLNHTHGTHYPAYTQGYKLVGIRNIAPGPAETLEPGANAALAIECTKEQADRTAVARLSSEISGGFEMSCSQAGGRQHLTPTIGSALLAIDDFSRKEWPVAVYRKLTWDEYPVAHKDFVVEHDHTLTSLQPTGDDGDPIPPVTAGRVLTLHGTAAKPNGTFTATLTLPRRPDRSVLIFTGLLSPTTTGQFRLRVANSSPWTQCGSTDQIFYAGREDFRTCSLTDRRVPQVEYGDPNAPAEGHGSVPVTFTVKHALGPWTLQLVYNSYRMGEDGQIVAP